MNGESKMEDKCSYFIGWDVGGWNCDRNKKSRDALVVLDSTLKIAGSPWRGNLRDCINQSKDANEFIDSLFDKCKIITHCSNPKVTMAIDAPLGFSQEFLKLATNHEAEHELNASNSNPYLFRQTERILFAKGLTPLSAIKDMIGSQATKGQHVLAKFAPTPIGCGVWTDGSFLKIIESYPSACRKSPHIQKDLNNYAKFASDSPYSDNDKTDALICALVAVLFMDKDNELFLPPSDIPVKEGWIWIPKDVFKKNHA